MRIHLAVIVLALLSGCASETTSKSGAPTNKEESDGSLLAKRRDQNSRIRTGRPETKKNDQPEAKEKSEAEKNQEAKEELDSKEAKRLADLDADLALLPQNEKRMVIELREKLKTRPGDLYPLEKDFVAVTHFRFFHVTIATSVAVSRAEDLKVADFLKWMRITDEKERSVAIRAYGMLPLLEAMRAKTLAEMISTQGLETIGDDGKRFVGAHKELFFPHKFVRP